MTQYWFTSDEHYDHDKVIKYSNRPFDSIEDMDRCLIANHNNIVKDQDVTIHAGDFCWLNKKEDVYKKYVSKLKGNHVMLVGSHDHWLPSSAHYVWRKRIDGNLIVVCHYAMRTWECSHYNSWQLYGHSHGNLPPIGKQHDIGVDNNNYCPVSFIQVATIMAGRPDNPNYIKYAERGCK